MTDLTATALKRHEILDLIELELQLAYDKHGREPWGRHEWYAITLEELEEAWELIRHDGPEIELHAEIVQVAAMCVRYLETGDRYALQRAEKDHAGVGQAVLDRLAREGR
jgi:hypothetical protein